MTSELNSSPNISAEIEVLAAQFDFETAFALIDAKANLRYAHGDLDAVFPLASVSKLFATYAALIAVEQGALTLDTVVQGSAVASGSYTLRHLLSHAAGFAFDSPEFLTDPGKRRMYSNAGIEQLAAVVSQAVKMPFLVWVEEQIVEPLGITSLELKGSAAKDFSGSVEDLLLLGHEYLRPTLLSAELAAQMRQIQFPELSGVLPGFGRQSPNPWGLGPEIKGEKHPHWTGSKNSAQTFGHFGQSGSFLWVDPSLQLSAAFLGAKPFGEIHAQLWQQLNDLLLEIASNTKAE